MKEIKVFEALKNADMSYLFPVFRSLLGYDPFVTFYEPDPDFVKLCKGLGEELHIPMDPDFIEFMSITNGCKIDYVKFFSFKDPEETKDLVYVNMNPEKRKFLVGDLKCFIAGENDGDYYCYDLLSVIKKDETATGYAWALYSSSKKEYMYSFPHFVDLLEFHSQLLRLQTT